MIDKKDIRKDKLSYRKSLTSKQINEYSESISNKLLGLDYYKQADIVLAYKDFKNEVMTGYIIDDAFRNGKKIFLPTVDSKTETMDFFKVSANESLNEGYFGILEPDTGNECFDYSFYHDSKVLMLVPGVAFDKLCFRIGYGKGFYDKYLAGENNIIKIGLCYEGQLAEELPHDNNDIQMNLVITEQAVYGNN